MDVYNRLFSGDELIPLGVLWNGALDGIPTVPQDGTLLREESGAVYVIYGGARFWVPNPDVFNQFFTMDRVRQMWNGALDSIPTIPKDGTLLREQSSTQTYIMYNGKKTPVWLALLTLNAHVLWDGALAQIPDGPYVPPEVIGVTPGAPPHRPG